jgi:hypothetical protein
VTSLASPQIFRIKSMTEPEARTSRDHSLQK